MFETNFQTDRSCTRGVGWCVLDMVGVFGYLMPRHPLNSFVQPIHQLHQSQRRRRHNVSWHRGTRPPACLRGSAKHSRARSERHGGAPLSSVLRRAGVEWLHLSWRVAALVCASLARCASPPCCWLHRGSISYVTPSFCRLQIASRAARTTVASRSLESRTQTGRASASVTTRRGGLRPPSVQLTTPALLFFQEGCMPARSPLGR